MSRTIEALKKFQKLYQDGKINELADVPEGLRFLLIRSLARKEYLETIAKDLEIKNVKTIKGLLEQVYLSAISSEQIEEILKKVDGEERSTRESKEEALLAELFKLRVFDWGGIHENDINKHIIDNYVKKIANYDQLVDRVENEILQSLKGFVLCSWYNNWTSIIIEDLFKSHPKILPTVGKIKQVDFFIDRIPFDLKMTYFPAGFMEDKRQEKGVVRSELSELKKACKQFNIPIDSTRPQAELVLDIIAALSESSILEVKEFYRTFTERRRQIIEETIQNPKPLLKWLYEKQGAQRFDASNRLFLIAIDRNKIEESWKLKRDHPLLKREINQYLSSRKFTKEELLVRWGVSGVEYESYADVLFVLK